MHQSPGAAGSKYPRPGRTQGTFILSLFCRLDVWGQGVCRVDAFWELWGRIRSRPLSSVYKRSSSSCVSSCSLPSLHASVSVPKFPLLVRASVIWNWAHPQWTHFNFIPSVKSPFPNKVWRRWGLLGVRIPTDGKFPTCEPSSFELSKMWACGPSVWRVSHVAAGPSALPSPTSAPSSSQSFFSAFLSMPVPVCQLLYCTLYFPRCCTVRLN